MISQDKYLNSKQKESGTIAANRRARLSQYMSKVHFDRVWKTVPTTYTTRSSAWELSSGAVNTAITPISTYGSHIRFFTSHMWGRV